MTPEEAAERMQTWHLHGIEDAASKIAHGAEMLQHYTRMLQSTPCFETLAEEAIDRAETTLTAALLVVKLAKQSYAEKPQDIPAFLEAAE